MADQERLRAMNAARVRRHRQRQRELAEVEAERTARRAEAIAASSSGPRHGPGARIRARRALRGAGGHHGALWRPSPGAGRP